MAGEVGIRPVGEELGQEVVGEDRRGFVREAVDRRGAFCEGGAGAGAVFLERGLLGGGELLEVLAGFVGPGRGRVALQEVFPGLLGGVHEVELLEGEGAVEPGFVRSVLELDRFLGGFEGLRDVGGLVEAARAHEVGRGEVAQQAGVLRGLGRRRLEGFDGFGDVARDEVGDGESPQPLGRGIALRALADAGDRGEDGRRLRVEALRGVAGSQHDEAAVLEASGQARFDEAPGAHRLGQLGDERGCRALRARVPELLERQEDAGGDRQDRGQAERGAAHEREHDRRGSWKSLLSLFVQGEAERLGEDLVAGRAVGQVLVHARGLGPGETALGVRRDLARIGMVA